MTPGHQVAAQGSVDYNVEYAHLYAYEVAQGVTPRMEQAVARARSVLQDLDRRGHTYTTAVLVDNYNSDVPVQTGPVREMLRRAGLEPDVICFEAELAESAAELIAALPDRVVVQGRGEILLDAASESFLLWPESTDMTSETYRHLLLGMLAGEEEARARPGSGAVTEPREANGEEARVTPLTTLRAQRSQVHLEVVLSGFDASRRLRWSCPVLATCWYLARLGISPYLDRMRTFDGLASRPFVGRRLLTLLPVDYVKIESTAMELLALARPKPLRKARKRLEYIFY